MNKQSFQVFFKLKGWLLPQISILSQQKMPPVEVTGNCLLTKTAIMECSRSRGTNPIFCIILYYFNHLFFLCKFLSNSQFHLL